MSRLHKNQRDDIRTDFLELRKEARERKSHFDSQRLFVVEMSQFVVELESRIAPVLENVESARFSYFAEELPNLSHKMIRFSFPKNEMQMKTEFSFSLWFDKMF